MGVGLCRENLIAGLASQMRHYHQKVLIFKYSVHLYDYNLNVEGK